MSTPQSQIIFLIRDQSKFVQFTDETKCAFLNVWEMRLMMAAEFHKRDDLRSFAQDVLSFVKDRIPSNLRFYVLNVNGESASFLFDARSEVDFPMTRNDETEHSAVFTIPENSGNQFSETNNDPIISWKRAVVLSCLAVYGPYFFTAVYTLFAPTGYDFNKHAWILLPFIPGAVPAQLASWLFGLPLYPWIHFFTSVILSISFILGLACLLRRARWLRYFSMVFAVIAFSIFAFLLHAMIRL